MSIYDKAPVGGLCAGIPINIWFPITKKGGSNAEERLRKKTDEALVLETCSQCEKRIHCLEYSLRHEPFGTWGGLNEVQRAELRLKRNIKMVAISTEGTQ